MFQVSRFIFSVIFLSHAFCFAEKQSELPEETQKQLATLVAANDYVAVVEINKGTFTGACMVHDKVKVVAHLKGKLGTTALFSSINADKNALPRPSNHQRIRCRFLRPEPMSLWLKLTRSSIHFRVSRFLSWEGWKAS